MNLIPLKKEQFPCLREACEDHIKMSSMEERITFANVIEFLTQGYDNRTVGAYVDSVEKPNACLIITHFSSVLTGAVSAFIHLVYVTPELRGTPAPLKALLDSAEAYARANGASFLVGSSWIYRGGRGSDALWKRNGFEPQETSYVKHLT